MIMIKKLLVTLTGLIMLGFNISSQAAPLWIQNTLAARWRVGSSVG